MTVMEKVYVSFGTIVILSLLILVSLFRDGEILTFRLSSDAIAKSLAVYSEKHGELPDDLDILCQEDWEMKYWQIIDYKRYPWGKEYHERVLYHNKPQTSSAHPLADVILASPVVFGGKRGVLRCPKENLGTFHPVEYCSDSEFRQTFAIAQDGKLTLKTPTDHKSQGKSD